LVTSKEAAKKSNDAKAAAEATAAAASDGGNELIEWFEAVRRSAPHTPDWQVNLCCYSAIVRARDRDRGSRRTIMRVQPSRSCEPPES
jgi:hypothetical protein